MKSFKKALEALGFVEPIDARIYLVRGPAGARFPHCNGYLMLGERIVLIDAGVGAERIGQIDRCLRIDTLIVSHSHPDHILAWHVLQDRELWLPAQTPTAVEDLRRLGQRFVAGSQGAQYWTWVAENRLGIHPMRRPDHRFDDRDTFDWGAVQLQAIHAPGHLNDHYCFLEQRSGVLFSVDIDFTGFGPWYGNPEGDVRRFRQSVEMLRRVPCRWVCAAHKAPIAAPDADDAFERYLTAFDRHKAAVLELCRQGMDLEAMVQHSPFYRNRMSDRNLQRIFETQMIQKNLALLIEEGRIVDAQDRYRAR